MCKEEELELLKRRTLREINDELSKSATNLVFGKGNPNAKILFIGEAPGENEDLKGEPFVGRAGAELDKLLNKIGLDLSDVYIANILKYRPPKNRDPTIEEIREHTPYLIEQIKIIRPKIIATLGNYATKFILSGCEPKKMGKIQGISVLHGKHKKINLFGFEVIIVPIYHPAAMLYRPQLREIMMKDFKEFAKIINISSNKKESKIKTLLDY